MSFFIIILNLNVKENAIETEGGNNMQQDNVIEISKLKAAFRSNDLEVIKRLIEEKKYHPNQKDNNGNTFLALACRYTQNLEVIKYLIQKGGDLALENKYGETLFALACGHN